ncbi:phage virion morphogenesis protein [Inquilinus sp. NPDC058860]|uniref:phage virion morphogenesis protein n=1 Tax=Inquilinus sp. NPDC058860 TaxID=3346652 RepID=UPI0036B31ABA
MVGVSTRVDSAIVQAALGRVSERMANARGLYDNIGAAMVVSTQMRFEREQAPDGSPWPKPLRVLIEGGNILRLSGRLYGSITHVGKPSRTATLSWPPPSRRRSRPRPRSLGARCRPRRRSMT